MPANYQFDGDDEQQLCISRKEYAAVLKKHKATAEKQQQRLRDVQAEYEGFEVLEAAAVMEVLMRLECSTPIRSHE
jgi:hypothetical protein